MMFTFYALTPVYLTSPGSKKTVLYTLILYAILILIHTYTPYIDLRLPQYLLAFAAGILVARSDLIQRFLGNGFSAGLSLVCFGVLARFFVRPQSAEIQFVIANFAILLSIPVFLWLGKILSPIASHKAVYILSYSSFAMYLFHRIIFKIGVMVYQPHGVMSSILYLAGVLLPIVIVFSYFFQKLYDFALNKITSSPAPQLADARPAAADAVPSHRRFGRSAFIALAVFVLMLAVSAYIRFNGVLDRGIMIGYSDNWHYLNVAREWAEGNHAWIVGSFYRPAIHILHAIAIKAGGYNDYSIKVMNGILDLVVVAALFMIAARIAGSFWVGVAATALYAFLPRVVELVWNEYPNAPSTAFVALSLLFFLVAMDKAKARCTSWPWLATSAICVSIGSNMHPDLAFLGPGYVAAMLLYAAAPWRGWETGRGFVCQAAVFTAAFFSLYLLGLLWFGPREFFSIIAREFGVGTSTFARRYGESGWLRCVYDVFRVSFNGFYDGRMLTFYLFLGAAALAAAGPSYKVRNPALYVPVVLLLVYAVLMAFFVKTFVLWRVFMPMLPLALIVLACWYHAAAKSILAKLTGNSCFAALPVVLLCLATAWDNPRWSPDLLKKSTLAPERIRLTYDRLRDKVGPDRKLLVMPVTSRFGWLTKQGLRFGLPHDIYFGNNALHLAEIAPFPLPYSIDSLRRIRREYSVRYMLVTTLGLREKELLDCCRIFRTLEGGVPYSREKEYEIIDAFLKESHARCIGNWEGGLYELPPLWEAVEIAKAWQFNVLPRSEWEWAFPKGRANQTRNGAVFSARTGSDNILLIENYPIDTADIAAIRLVCLAREQTGDAHQIQYPPRVVLAWGRRPNQARIVLTQDPEHPGAYTGWPMFAEKWRGELDSLALIITAPPPAKPGCEPVSTHICVQSIELAKTEPTSATHQ
jgi:hypothetical protein